MEVAENNKLGRAKIVDMNELLVQERAWTITFLGLRDGSPESEPFEVPGGIGSSMLIASKDERGHRSLKAFTTGRQWLQASVRFATEPSEIIMWSKMVRKAEEAFDNLARGKTIWPVRQGQRPAERHLFDALMRAKTAAQVRRICRRSNDWLKYRWDFPRGGFCQLPSACPRALYECAEEFCRAKLDPRYPARDRRASGDYRRIQYFARVMAGLSLPKAISPSYAVELLRKLKRD